MKTWNALRHITLDDDRECPGRGVLNSHSIMHPCLGVIKQSTLICSQLHRVGMLSKRVFLPNLIDVLTRDNCAVDKLLGRICDKPLVGCASHRLHLASKYFLNTHGMRLFKLTCYLFSRNYFILPCNFQKCRLVKCMTV